MTNAILIVLAVAGILVIAAGTVNALFEFNQKWAAIINISAVLMIIAALFWVGITIYNDSNESNQEIVVETIEEAEFAEEPAELEPTEVASEDIPSPGNLKTDIDIEKAYNYSIIVSKYGEPMNFNDHSLRVRESERFEATGFFDAVTYSTATDEEKKADGWIENFVYDEVRSNPIYASGVFQALKEIGIIGKNGQISDWAKAYEEKMTDTFGFVGELTPDKLDALNDGEEVTLPLSDEYNEYSSYMVELLHGASNEGIHNVKEGWKVLKQYALDPDNEIIVSSTKNDKYDFWVFKFLDKDGTERYIGVNVKDYRILILSKPTVTPKKATPKTPATPKPTVTPTPTPQPTPKPDPQPTPKPDPKPDPQPQKNPDDRPGPHDDEPDDKGPGTFEPTKPEWPSTPTIIVGDDPGKDLPPVIDPSADVIDQNKPDYEPIPVHESSYSDGSNSTTDPVNNGTVDPF